ncbi:hypothetical protein DASC09_019030 [Saccharomycopsis crataegensis]|uniref:LYC1 C-terminal domain-containing protein n=1 Tax=Saccharomycopsis crataegensis TaxID=43959 RepID=A0AAV5QIA7_9ASCO|nr:hypothetical protein DASC09_019030 [Saccharomycopsis crataegensis]
MAEPQHLLGKLSLKDLTIHDSTGRFQLSPALPDTEVSQFVLSQNGVAWKGSLTTDQYYLREKVLGNTQAYKRSGTDEINGSWRFILRDLSISLDSDSRNNDILETYNVVSSLELLVRDAHRIKATGKATVELLKVKTGCIGSVYTFENQRKKGYARMLVDLLNDWSRKFLNHCDKDDDNYSFNTMYSEIGEYYAKNHYISRHVPWINIPLNGSFDNANKESSFEVALIDKGGFEELVKKSNEYDQLKFIKLCTEETQQGINNVRLFLDFNVSSVDCLHERAAFYNKYLNDSQPLKFGLNLTRKTEEGEEEIVGFIIWTYNFNDQDIEVLKIGCFISETSDDKAIYDADLEEQVYKILILEMLKYVGGALDSVRFAKGIKIWQTSISSEVLQRNTFRNWIIEELRGKLDLPNEESLSAITSFNDSDQSLIEQNKGLIWEANEKWAWF